MWYEVYVSLRNDENEGWVWITKPDVSGRSVIRIENKENNKVVFCEARIIDCNYRKHYNETDGTRTLSVDKNVITINEWYRKKLDINKNEDCELSITTADNWYGRFHCCPINFHSNED